MVNFATMLKTAGGIAGATVAGLAFTTTPVQAATVATATVVQPGQVRFDAGSGQVNNLRITAAGRVVTLDDDVRINAGAGCTPVTGDDTQVTCDLGAPPAALGLVVNVLDRDDVVFNESPIGMLANGGAGADLLQGSPTAPDTVEGGPGDDELSGAVSWESSSVGDTLRGGAGTDKLFGASGDDRLEGGAGNDTLYGNEGDDALVGGAGNDELIGGLGADLQNGGEGRDGVFYTERSEPVTADLDNARGDDGEAGEGDSLINLEDIYGTTADDVLTGNDGDNALYGGSGKDTISGLGGDDLLEGGVALDGPDALDGGDNRTEAGDVCRLSQDGGTTVNCESVEG